MPSSPRTCSTFNVARNDGILMPVMVADLPDGKSRIVTEFIRFLGQSNYSLQTMRAAAAVLGFLNDYLLIARKGEAFESDELPAAINHFLRLRRYGDKDNEHGLSWSPVRASTVARDARIVADFSKYCSESLRHFPLVRSTDFGERQHNNFMTLLRQKVSSSWRLLGHLDKRLPKKGFENTPKLPERPTKAKGSAKRVLTGEEVSRIIECTASPSHKALFILCAFGGPRVSETLHIWSSDVMPGKYRNGLFGRDRDENTPLVILAHPSQSTLIAVQVRTNEDRQQHLSSEYGLTARNLVQGSALHAGWKGMLADDETRAISEVFWTSESMARRFWEIAWGTRADARKLGAGENMDAHPYFFINDTPGKAEFGMPTKLSNVKKSFARSCVLAGIQDSGHGIHLLRHFYKATLVDMGLKPETIRHAMHHRSVTSQGNYGVDPRRIHDAIAKAMKARGRDER